MISLTHAALAAFIAILFLFFSKMKSTNPEDKRLGPGEEEVVSLKRFDYRRVDPAKHRPFLSSGHVRMGK
jgi:hypothetical protein